MIFRKEKAKFDKEFKEISDKHRLLVAHNEKEIAKRIVEINDSKNKFDSRWNSIRKTKQ